MVEANLDVGMLALEFNYKVRYFTAAVPAASLPCLGQQRGL